MADKITETAIREIRAEMARQRITQAQLAHRLGWSAFQVSRRLRGQTPLSLRDLEAIATALAVPTTQFTGEPVIRAKTG